MKYCIISIILFLGLSSVKARNVTMRDVFKQMPDTLLPYLSHNNKLDLIDFFDSNMKAEVNNALDGHSLLTQLTHNYIRLELSSASVLEMLILPSTKELPDSSKHVVCMVMTFGDSIKESTVRFYTSKWNILHMNNPISPELIKQLSNSDTTETQQFANAESIFAVAKLSPTEEVMTVTITTPPIPVEDKRPIKPAVLSTTLKWGGESFK